MQSICGADCANCDFSRTCGGCRETGGRPFGKPCLVAACCQRGENTLEELKTALMAAFNDLHIPDMEPVTELYALKGSIVNLAYPLPGGQTVTFWEDDKIYLGTQLPKRGSDRCYGLAADETHLLVSEYGGGGEGGEIVVFKRWRK